MRVGTRVPTAQDEVAADLMKTRRLSNALKSTRDYRLVQRSTAERTKSRRKRSACHRRMPVDGITFDITPTTKLPGLEDMFKMFPFSPKHGDVAIDGAGAHQVSANKPCSPPRQTRRPLKN